MWRLITLLCALLAFAAPARADDVSAASRGVVRVVVVQVEGDEIVDFGHGSGFAVAPNRIVTNAHVVQLALENPEGVAIGVVPSEGSASYAARIVAVDPERDLALLEMQEGSVPPLALFTGRLEPGTAVAALGYPGNVDLATARSMQDYVRPLPPTRSMGNFSDLRQGDIGTLLVHTADIARGHSGGPLVDTCGRVIGVNRMITRNDSGDSTFGFAIPVSTVADFLRAARQSFRGVDTECVSLADRQRDEAARAEQERQAAAQAAAERAAQEQQRRERALLTLEESRETRLGIAVLLLVLSLAALGATGILVVKNKPRIAIGTGAAAAALLVAAAVVFFTRPSLEDVLRDQEQQTDDAPAAATRAGANLCRLERERSRVTVSNEPEVRLNWGETGCVNGNTQYAQDGSVWRRVLVPNSDQTVTVSEFNPATGDYVVNRYLLSATAMEEARRLRRRIEQKSCTADAEARAILADRQRDLLRALPRAPNERLVYRCGPA